MAVVLRTYKTIRNNWKKSLFGACLVSYGISSAKTRYDTNVFMRVCCEEAMKYGEERLPVTVSPRSITVILNPAANKRTAKTDYEKYCEPLFHMAGISVTLLQTNSEGHAKELVQGLPENESIVAAGGDGTVSEAITGLLREDENKCKRTIGILPLGRRNLVGNQLFPIGDTLPKIKQLTDATMAIIKNHSQSKNVMKIEAIETDSESPGKPIFAIGSLEWGAFRDAYAKRDKYWYYGGLRDYATFLFNGYKSSLTWDCKGSFKYSPPCDGCNNCRPSFSKQMQKSRWLDLVMPKVKDEGMFDKDYSDISNLVCNTEEEKCFKTSEVKLTLEDGDLQVPPHLSISLGKMKLGYIEYVSEAWKRLNKNPPTVNEVFTARTLEIHPLNVSQEGKEIWFAIDNEEFDVKPIKITFIPRAIKIFTKE